MTEPHVNCRCSVEPVLLPEPTVEGLLETIRRAVEFIDKRTLIVAHTDVELRTPMHHGSVIFLRTMLAEAARLS